MFEQACPYYMAIGMTYDQYWYGDAWLAKYYKDAHRIQLEERNTELWLQGMYVYNAFSVVISNAFGGKGSHKQKYFEKPVDIFKPSEQELKRRADQTRQKLVDRLNAWKAMWDKQKAET